ncbi:MAG: hypothetical protein AAGF88_08435 [Pseudomonadota bacterium]
MTYSNMCRSTAIAAILSATVPHSASAQDITFAEFFSLERLATAAVQGLLNAARSVAEIRYVDLDIRPLDSRFAIIGLEISPYDLEDYPDCNVSIDRVVVRSNPILQIDQTSVTLDIAGANFPVGCLPPWDRDELLAFGFDEIYVNAARIHADYTVASSALETDFFVQSESNGTLSGTATFDYASIYVEDLDAPVFDLSDAYIEFTNDGLWERFSAEIPPFVLNPDALVALLSEELLPNVDAAPPAAPAPEVTPQAPATGGKGDDPIATPAPDAPPPAAPAPAPASPEIAAAQDFLVMAAEAVAGFANTPERISITLSPDAPVRLDEDSVEDFEDFVAAFRPAIRLGAPAPVQPSAALSAALAAQLGSDGAELEPDTRLALASALVDGAGMPRSPELAIVVLEPLLDAGDVEALLIVEDHLDQLPAEDVYLILHRAAAEGSRSAYLAMDAAEVRLGMAGVLAAQGSVTATAAAEATAGAARAALVGLERPRSYADAYYLALLSEAAGDRSAGAIVNEIEAMGDISDAPEAWSEMLSEVQATVFEAWLAAHGPAADAPAPETDE